MKKIHILFVDDEQSMQDAIRLYLEEIGSFHVDTLSSAEEALQRLSITPYDIIISDYVMPEMDALSFLKKLRTSGNDTPFILFTGKGREEVAIEVFEEGADIYLQKCGNLQAQFNELSNKIHYAVACRRSERELSKSKIKTSDIIEFLPDATFAINSNGVVIAWNRAIEEMTGMSKNDMIGQGDHAYMIPFYGEPRQSLLDLIDLDDENLRSSYHYVQRQGHTLYAEVFTPALYHNKGAYLWITGAPLFDTTGNRIGAIESIRDVSERKQAENELRKKNSELQAAYEQISITEEDLRSHLDELIRQKHLVQKSEEQFQSLFMNMIEGAVLHDLIYNDQGIPEDYIIIETNSAFEKHLGISRDMVIGKTSREAYGVSDPPYFDIYTRVALTGNSEVFETFFPPLAKYFSVSVYCPYKGSFVTIFEDITGRKQTEKALVKSEEKYRSYIENSPEAIFLVDSTGRYLDVNPSACLMLGYSCEEFLTLSIHDHISADTREATLSEFIKLQETGSLTSELILLKKNGETLPIILNAVQLSDQRYLGFCTDISERKREEKERECLIIDLASSNEELNASYEELTASEEELRSQYYTLAKTEEDLRTTKEFQESLITNANVPIIVWDPLFSITRMNYAFEQLIGRTPEEIIGNSLEFLFPPDQADRSMRLIQTTQDGVRWKTVEMDIMHRDGSLRTLLWNSSTLYTQDGLTPVATIAQGHDITGERRLEQEKDTAMTQIQKNLAHLAILNDEIRNPLTIIMTYADMLGDSQVTDQIFVQAQRIDEMVNQLDRRWMESEKVLNALRKHYQIDTNHSSELNKVEKADIHQAVPLIKRESASPIKGTILIEEVQAQLYTILDSIDALVYVADMDTHEVLFINQRGRSRFGDIVGQKCYKTIQYDQDSPCSFCTNHLLTDRSESSGVYQWEFQNPRNGRWYDCRDRAIRWSDGRLVRLEIATDITDRKQAEENLQESEDRFRTILNSLQFGIVIIDAQSHTIVEANQRACEMIGSDGETISGSVCHRFICPAELGRCPITDLGQTVDSSDRVLLTKEGEAKPVLKTVINTSLGGHDVLIESFIDITELKKTELELISTQERLKEVHHLARIGTWEWCFENDIVIWSEEMFNIAGRDPSSPAPTYSEYPQFHTPSSWEKLNNAVSRTLTTGESYDIELELVLPDGSIRWTNTFGGVKRDENGTIIGLHGTVQDINERKQVEDELRIIQSRLESAMEAGNIAWWEMDCITGKVDFNERKARMLGYPADHFSHYTDFTTLVHPDDYEPIMQAMRDHLSGIKDQYEVDYRICTQGGEYRWFHDIGKISDSAPDGSPLKVIGLVIDITYRKQAEESLYESNQKLRLLTGLTRHDILNQVCAVQLLQDLALETSDTNKVTEYITRAQETVSQMEETIGFTREYETFGIESSGWQQVHIIVESSKSEVAFRGVTVNNQIPDNLEVYADPIIRKVFTTILENAIRHGECVTSIRISCSEVERNLIITCEDDGVGVPYEEKGYIFDHGHGKHTGIGLFLTREILSITGLLIRECGIPGEGARFEIMVSSGKYRIHEETP